MEMKTWPPTTSLRKSSILKESNFGLLSQLKKGEISSIKWNWQTQIQSFQRVEVVPSLPIHFCDCEEHSIHHPTAKEKQTCDLETLSDGLSEEELSRTNSVMNKLFERENLLDAVGSGKGLAEGRDTCSHVAS